MPTKSESKTITRAAVKRGTKGRYLEVLMEDRGNR